MGQCFVMYIYFEGINILLNTVLSVYALIIFMVFQKFFMCYPVITLLFASFKLVANLKMLSENLFRIPFSMIG
jgi:hypothetical protein